MRSLRESRGMDSPREPAFLVVLSTATAVTLGGMAVSGVRPGGPMETAGISLVLVLGARVLSGRLRPRAP